MGAIDELERVDITVDGVTVNVVGGSFKGVPFFVDEYEMNGGGRNIVSNPIPFSSNYVSQDLGGKIPTHPINVYLIGRECKQARDNLIAACNEEGAGELIHPFFGRFQAECISLTVAGGKSGVNYCTLQVEFRPVSAAEGRPVQANLAGIAKAAASESQKISVDKFSDSFTVSGKGKGVVDLAVEFTQKAMDAVLSARQALATVNDFVSAVGAMKANAATIMMAPADFVTRLENIVTATKEMFGIESEENDVDEYLDMLERVRDLESGENPAGKIAATFKNFAASMVASSLLDAKFSSVDDAAAMQNKVASAFGWLLEQTDDVDDYMSISNMESASLGYLRSTMENIAVVLEKDISYSNNVLQVCYDVYGSVDRAEEIIERNGLVQGLFILPGKIKVLSK